MDQLKMSSEELMQAQTLLWTHIFNHIGSQSLKCAVELNIPDAIHNHGKPISLDDLVSTLSIPASKQPQLRRLMRLLTHSGIFAEEELNSYSLTPVSSLLVKNQELSLSPFTLAMFNPMLLNPFMSMSNWFKSTDHHGPTAASTPFSFKYGCHFWEMMDQNPQFNTVFNDAMASDARLLMSVLVKDCGFVFEGVTSLVDVGGGTGSTALAIAEAFPGVNISVLELPHVVEGINISGEKRKGRVDFIAGDMFEYIPAADAVWLQWILHDWGDEDCVKILKRCKEAILPDHDGGGKVIIIDLVMGSKNCYRKPSTAELYMDMMMMVEVGGVEREEQEWKKIFIDAGFQRYKIIPALGLRSIIELYP